MKLWLLGILHVCATDTNDNSTHAAREKRCAATFTFLAIRFKNFASQVIWQQYKICVHAFSVNSCFTVNRAIDIFHHIKHPGPPQPLVFFKYFDIQMSYLYVFHTSRLTTVYMAWERESAVLSVANTSFLILTQQRSLFASLWAPRTERPFCFLPIPSYRLCSILIPGLWNWKHYRSQSCRILSVMLVQGAYLRDCYSCRDLGLYFCVIFAFDVLASLATSET